MFKKFSWLTLLAFLPVALIVGCSGEFGKVDQGRAIAFDKDQKTVTILRNKGITDTPDFVLPPVTYSLPTDPDEMGPEPTPGKRLNLDVKNREIVIYDTNSQTIKKVQYEVIDQKEKVGKDDPLVTGKKFPIVDRDKKTVTVYSGRQKILVTFSLPAEYFLLPDNTWEAGDSVRIYYKEPGKAARLMNVTKTDIYKK